MEPLLLNNETHKACIQFLMLIKSLKQNDLNSFYYCMKSGTDGNYSMVTSLILYVL